MNAAELRVGNFVNMPVFSNNPLIFTEKICADFGYAIVKINSTHIRDAEYYKEDWAAKPRQTSSRE